MKISIHQPEHFPYLGFFSKMANSDLFVILDDVKFRKNYFQNRNRFINKAGAEEWFTVPVQKKDISKNINEVRTSPELRWRKKLLKQLQMNFREDLSDIYSGDKLVSINLKSIEYCRQKLNITTPLVLSSNLEVSGSGTEKLVNICRACNAKSYLSGPMGKEYLDLQQFFNFGIDVDFFKPEVNNYYSTLYNIHS